MARYSVSRQRLRVRLGWQRLARRMRRQARQVCRIVTAIYRP